MSFSKFLAFINNQDKKYKKILYLGFGLYYFVRKVALGNKSHSISVSGQVSDDVYPLM
jgi:hypothetical protein